MKIILTPNDQAVAIQSYLLDNYNIVTYIDESTLTNMDLDIPPLWVGEKVEPVTEVELVEEDDRQWAITRAEELGINFRSDIKTSTLITRIEETENELAKAARNPDPLPMDDELENEHEEAQEQEVPEEQPQVEIEQEEQEEPVSTKKPSIFDKRQ